MIALARRHANHNRIFSFGIGAAASAHLVNGLARATGGAAEFISASERIDEKVLRTFGRMASPMVSDVEIEWGGADVQTLAEVPPLFDGDAVAVYGRALGSAPREVTLKCRLSRDGREMKWSLPVGHPIPDDGVVATMWARRAIQSFEEVNGVRRTSARLREQSRDRERLIALSKQFNLVCSLTSFIAVEHRTLEERNDGQPAVRRVPVMLAKGWGGIPAPRMASVDSRHSIARCCIGPSEAEVEAGMHALRARMRKRPSADDTGPMFSPMEAGILREERVDRTGAAAPGAATAAVPPPDPQGDELMTILMSQFADGAFGYRPDDSRALSPKLQADLAVLTGGDATMIKEGVLRTILCLAVLQLDHKPRRAMWRRAHEKGCGYVATVLGVATGDVTRMLDAIERQFATPATQPS